MTKEAEESAKFCIALTRNAPRLHRHDVIRHGRFLWCAASSYQRLQIYSCNRPLTTREKMREARLEDRIKEAAKALKLVGVKVDGDPRSRVVKVFFKDKQINNTMGGVADGYAVGWVG